MLSLPTSVRIYLARGATDMRKAINGLSSVAREVLREDPMSGHLFVFCNRTRNRLKILYWEETGYWLLHKRLEKGHFPWPTDGPEAKVHSEHAELSAILGGIDLTGAKRKRWYGRDEKKTRIVSSTSPADFVQKKQWTRTPPRSSKKRMRD